MPLKGDAESVMTKGRRMAMISIDIQEDLPGLAVGDYLKCFQVYCDDPREMAEKIFALIKAAMGDAVICC